MRTAVVVGFDYHVGVLCKRMNRYSRTWRFRAQPSTQVGLLLAALRLRFADALISFAGPSPHPILISAARAFNVPIFVIWAGSDVTNLVARPSLLSQAKRSEFTHLAVAPWLVEELRRAGVEATYLPIIGVSPTSVPMPQGEFNILTYLPEPRRDFYGRSHVYEVARNLPSSTFWIVGAGDPDHDGPPNVKFLGWRSDINSLLNQSVALLRVPEHDGMSLIVLEALARGRYVLWNHFVPGVEQVTIPGDSINFLTELRARSQQGALAPNMEGTDYITNTYEERKVAEDLARFFDVAVPKSRGKKARTSRVAIFGLDLFSTEVAALTNNLPTNWRAQVLQFENNYEISESLYELARSRVLYILGAPAIGRSTSLVANWLKKPQVMHWVGTDIEYARRHPDILKPLLSPSVIHLTEVEWEAEELLALGINAKIAPLPPRFSSLGAIPPLPNEFTLLVYLPSTRAEFYGSKELRTVIQAFRGERIRFLIIGGGRIDAPPDVAVDNLGWCYALDPIYAKSSALLRYTLRDGLSLMVLEALALGRHVLWTKNFPYVKKVLDADDICQKLAELLDQHKRGELAPQAEAAEFVRNTYNREKCLARIVDAWEEARSKVRAEGR